MTAVCGIFLGALALVEGVAPLCPPPPDAGVSGIWSQYARQPTDGQIWYHTTQTGLLVDPEQYDAFIAVLDCADVGSDAWIRVDDSQWLRAFIYDCSGHESTTQWFLTAGVIGEIDYYTVQRFGVQGRGVPGRLYIEGGH